MIKRSFLEAGAQRDAPEKKRLLARGEQKLQQLGSAQAACEHRCDRASMEEFYSLAQTADTARAELMRAVMTTQDKVRDGGAARV
jgi:superfamily II RNA helicase